MTSHRNLIGSGKLYDLQEVKSSLRFILLEALGKDAVLEDLKEKEDTWRTRLGSWDPEGLNLKED